MLELDPQQITIPKPSPREVIKNILAILVILALAYLVIVSIGLDGLRERVTAAGIYAPLILIVLKAATIVIAPLGGTIIYPVAGVMFGFGPGLAITLLGDALGSAIAFFISRRFGRSILDYFTGPSERVLVDQVITRLGDEKKLLVTRIYFIGFMDMFAYAAGLTRVRFWYFLLVHIAVHAIPAALIVAFGDLLISGNWWLVTAVAIAGLAVAAIGVWRFKVDLVKSN